MPRRASGQRAAGRKSVLRGRPKGSKNAKRTTAVGGESGRLIAEMRAYHDDLTAKCSQMQVEMDALSSAIESISGVALAAPTRSSVVRRVTKGGVTRGPRPAGGSLKEVITKVLGSAQNPLRLTEISTGVVRAGYKTKSKNLSNQVSMALADMAKKRKVKKVSRGLYRA